MTDTPNIFYYRGSLFESQTNINEMLEDSNDDEIELEVVEEENFIESYYLS